MSPLHLECRLSSISASKQIATGAILSVKCQPIMISKSYVYSNITYYLGHLMLLGSIDLHLSVSSFLLCLILHTLESLGNIALI